MSWVKTATSRREYQSRPATELIELVVGSAMVIGVLTGCTPVQVETPSAPTSTAVPNASTPTPTPPATIPSPLADRGPEEAATGTAVAAADGGFVYTVNEGDTMIGIAHRFGISEDDVINVNSLTDYGLIQIGQELQIQRY